MTDALDVARDLPERPPDWHHWPVDARVSWWIIQLTGGGPPNREDALRVLRGRIEQRVQADLDGGSRDRLSLHELCALIALTGEVPRLQNRLSEFEEVQG